MHLLRHTLLFFIILAGFGLHAQTASEALRLSQNEVFGTARNLGTGNSMFAIGPENSVIGQNPSGLAGFRKSEFSATLGFNNIDYTASFANDLSLQRSAAYGTVTLNNIGFVVVNVPRGSKWRTSNWAIGMNRLGDYKRQIQYAGNTLGSITDSWRENATGINPNELNGFEEGLAYESGAIYDFEEDNIYETDYRLNPDYALRKEERTFLTGGKSEIYMAYAANWDEKIWFGFSANLPLVNYSEDRLYQEIDEAGDGVPFFNDLQYTRNVNTTGYGINAKAGLTVKPSKALQIAISVETPTKLFLTDNYNTTLTYDWTDENHSGPIRAESPYGSFQFALSTPWSLSGGLGIIASQSGFVSASVKLTDYGSMKFDYSVRGNGNSYQQLEREVNQTIRNTFESALQLNLGGELVIDALRLRGGVSLDQSPYRNDKSFENGYHLGIGYRWDAFYLDLGYRFSQREEGYLPYETIDAPQPLVVIDNTRHRVAITTGFKF